MYNVIELIFVVPTYHDTSVAIILVYTNLSLNWVSVPQFFSILLQHDNFCFQFLCIFPNWSVYSSIHINTVFYACLHIEPQLVYIYLFQLVLFNSFFCNWCVAALILFNTSNVSLSVSNCPGVSKSPHIYIFKMFHILQIRRYGKIFMYIYEIDFFM